MAYSTELKGIKSNVMIYKERTFSTDALDEYMQMFKEFQAKGVILADNNFEDDNWIVDNGVQRMVVKFIIDEITFKASFKSNVLGFKLDDLLNAMKCFALLKLDNAKTTTVRKYHLRYNLLTKADPFLCR